MAHKFTCEFGSPSKSLMSTNYATFLSSDVCCNCEHHFCHSAYSHHIHGNQTREITTERKARTCKHEHCHYREMETKDEYTDAKVAKEYFCGPNIYTNNIIEEVTIAQTKPVVRKRVHKIYLPEIDDKQVGQSITDIQASEPSEKYDEAVNTDLRTKSAKPLNDVKEIGVGRNCECGEEKKCENQNCQGNCCVTNQSKSDPTSKIATKTNSIKSLPSETLKSYFNKDIVEDLAQSKSYEEVPHSEQLSGMEVNKVDSVQDLIKPSLVEIVTGSQHLDHDTFNDDSESRCRDIEKLNLSIQNLRREICRIDDTPDLKELKSEIVQVHLSQPGQQTWIVLEDKQQYKFQAFAKNDKKKTKKKTKFPKRTERKEKWIFRKTKIIFHKLEIILHLLSKHLSYCHKAQTSDINRRRNPQKYEGLDLQTSVNLLLQLSTEQICNVVEYESSYLLYNDVPNMTFKNKSYERQSRSRLNQWRRSQHSKRSHKSNISNISKRSYKSTSSIPSSLSHKSNSSHRWQQSRRTHHMQKKEIWGAHKNEYLHVNPVTVSYPRYCAYRTKLPNRAFCKALSSKVKILPLYATATSLKDNISLTSPHFNTIAIPHSCMDLKSSHLNHNDNEYAKKDECHQEYSSNTAEYIESNDAADIYAAKEILKSLLMYMHNRSPNKRSKRLIDGEKITDENKVQITANKTTDSNFKGTINNVTDVSFETKQSRIKNNYNAEDDETQFDKELYDKLVLSQEVVEKKISNSKNDRCHRKEMAYVNVRQCDEAENLQKLYTLNTANAMHISNVLSFTNNVLQISELFPESYCFM